MLFLLFNLDQFLFIIFWFNKSLLKSANTTLSPENRVSIINELLFKELYLMQEKWFKNITKNNNFNIFDILFRLKRIISLKKV